MVKKSRHIKKPLLIAIGIVIVLAVAGCLLWKHHKDVEAQKPHPPHPINYNPPTQEEKDQTQAHKEELSQQSNQSSGSGSTGTSAGAQSVSPVITNASQLNQQITVNAYVPGIFEDGGTCTATFTKGGATVTKTSQGFANVNTTSCAPITANRSEFSSSGDWQVIVSYSSSKASGSSQSKVVTLQ